MRSPDANRFLARAPTGWSAIVPGLVAVGAIGLIAGLVAGLSGSVSSLVVGIVAGAVVANVGSVPAEWAPGIAFGTRTLLRGGVVLLGLRLSLGDLAGLGVNGLGVVAATVAVTFVGTRWFARRLGLRGDLGLLVATGYAICGASAIAAMDSVIDADEEETAYAVSLVTLCGTLSIVALPALAGLVGVTGEAFGTWVGGAVHDVGQVVATASHGDTIALEAATVVKLTRVVLLAPLVAVIALARRRAASGRERLGDDPPARRPPVLPLFVAGFLAAIVVRTAGVLGDGALDAAGRFEQVLLTVALVALGLGVRIDRMRGLGGRPLVLGLLAWVLVAGTAFAGTIAVS